MYSTQKTWVEYKQLQPDFQKGDKISIIRPQSCLRQRVKKQVKMSIDILGTVGRGNISAEFHVLQTGTKPDTIICCTHCGCVLTLRYVTETVQITCNFCPDLLAVPTSYHSCTFFNRPLLCTNKCNMLKELNCNKSFSRFPIVS